MTDRFEERAELIRSLVDPLLSAVYAQGREGRDHDDEEDSAQTADDALMNGIKEGLRQMFEAGRQDAMKSEIAWEATTPVYKQFITQERYEGFKKNGFHRWYKPYRCSSCNHAETATQALQVIAAGLETYDIYGNLRIIPLPNAHKIAQEALEKTKEERDANL